MFFNRQQDFFLKKNGKERLTNTREEGVRDKIGLFYRKLKKKVFDKETIQNLNFFVKDMRKNNNMENR